MKLFCVGLAVVTSKSRPVWGAWIEIPVTVKKEFFQKVAPRMGRVD